MADKPTENRYGASWACVCDQCTTGRQAKPPTPEQLTQYAELIAERNRVGQRPERRSRKRREYDEESFL